MNINDMIFEPYNDMGIDDIKIVTQHKNLISEKKYSDATTLLNDSNYKKGIRASLLNSTQNKIRKLQEYLLNEFVAENDEYYSFEEPDIDFMNKNGYKFWVQPY